MIDGETYKVSDMKVAWGEKIHTGSFSEDASITIQEEQESKLWYTLKGVSTRADGKEVQALTLDTGTHQVDLELFLGSESLQAILETEPTTESPFGVSVKEG